MKTILANATVDFIIFCVFFIGFGLLARFVPELEWAYVGFNILLFLGILGGVIVALYNGITGWINNKTGGTPPAPMNVVDPATPAA